MRLILFLVSLFFLLPGSRIDSFGGQTNRQEQAKCASLLQVAANSPGVATNLPGGATSLPGVAKDIQGLAADLATFKATNAPEHNRIDICEDRETEDDREVFTRKLKMISSFLISTCTPTSSSISQLNVDSPAGCPSAPIYLILGVLRL